MKNTMFSILLLAVCVVSTYGASNHTRPPHIDSSSINFFYEPDYHYIVAVTRTTCFMAPLTYEERDHVHTVQGLEDIELRMMREWIGQLAEIKIYHDDMSLPPYIKNQCHTRDIYLLQRQLTAETTHTSPLG